MSERKECIAFVKDFRINYRPYRKLLIHFANEGLRPGRTGAILKAMGLVKGCPDYFLAVPSGDFHGMFIEMKLPGTENKKKDADQDAMLEELSDVGYCCTYAYGWEDAIKKVDNYINIPSKCPQL